MPSLQEILRSAIEHHDAGRLSEAEAMYRQVVDSDPASARAWYGLGLLAVATGHASIAVALISQAIQLQPGNAEWVMNLGLALQQIGQADGASSCYERAIAMSPAMPEARRRLGELRHQQGRLEEAIACYYAALSLAPKWLAVRRNLAYALRDCGRRDDAIACMRKAVELEPASAEANFHLANVLQGYQQDNEAEHSYRRALGIQPENAESWNNLGNVLHSLGRLPEALNAFDHAIAIRADYVGAHFNRGRALRFLHRLAEATSAYMSALQYDPAFAEAHHDLGAIALDQFRLDEAAAEFEQALAARPNYADAMVGLSAVQFRRGQASQGVELCRRALALDPANSAAHHSLCFRMHFLPETDGEAILRVHQDWERVCVRPLRRVVTRHDNVPEPTRRLRIGYVSADLRYHVIGRFLLPLLANHDRSAVQVYCYDSTQTHDELTQSLREHVDVWRRVETLSDEQLAAVVRQDRIDILIDLAMHAAGSRLLMFARKPAPVQACYLAYCSTTGLPEMDYRISDPFLDPSDRPGFYTEQTLRLSASYWCYHPLQEAPDVTPPPAPRSGQVTFGCLNSPAKLSESAIGTFAKVMRAVPGSRLLLHCDPGSHRSVVLARFAAQGVSADRIELAGYLRAENYFGMYQRIDVALDPFPYAGGTTTCDALWMGVPVVTLAGTLGVGRSGVSILTNAGVPELIVRTPDEYVKIATDLAADMPRLAEYRRTLRERMAASPLMDGPRIARDMEGLYREMWRRWCASR